MEEIVIRNHFRGSISLLLKILMEGKPLAVHKSSVHVKMLGFPSEKVHFEYEHPVMSYTHLLGKSSIVFFSTLYYFVLGAFQNLRNQKRLKLSD